MKKKVILNCECCKKDFEQKHAGKPTRCCSRECGYKIRSSGKTKTTLNCLWCDNNFYSKSGHLKQKCCSAECKYKYINRNGSKKKGKSYPHLQRAEIKECTVCKKEFRAIDEAINRSRKFCSKECWSKRNPKIQIVCVSCDKVFFDYKKQNRVVCGVACKAKLAKTKIGELSSCWKGGVSLTNDRARNSSRLKEWKKAIYIRDNYTCQRCGECKAEMHAHHLKSFAEYKDLRYDLDNGLTLCINCHGEEHNRDFRRRKCKNCGVKIIKNKMNMCTDCQVIIDRYINLKKNNGDDVYLLKEGQKIPYKEVAGEV